MPVTLDKVIQALFNIEKRQNPTQLMRTSLTQERLSHYRDILENTEFEILVSIGFD